MPYAHITGWGMAVPEPILTNDDISKMVDTNDAWIRERTGIHERRIARDNEFPSTLGVEASINALTVANLRPTDLDLIICTSSSPEYIFPATACLIQDQLGATKAGAFDLLAACTATPVSYSGMGPGRSSCRPARRPAASYRRSCTRTVRAVICCPWRGAAAGIPQRRKPSTKAGITSRWMARRSSALPRA